MKKAFPWLRDKQEPAQNGNVLIKGEKVAIREKRVVDVVDDYAWRTDEELARLDATRPIRMTYEEFYRFSKDEIANVSSTSHRLAIDTYDGRHIGNCMYYDIDRKRGEAELGIMIGDRAYWGRGYGTDSVNTLVEHIFTTTGLSRVYLHTLEWNERARHSFAKSGFREVKPVHRSGHDFILMEIFRTDWESRGGSEDGASNLETQAASGNGAAS